MWLNPAQNNSKIRKKKGGVIICMKETRMRAIHRPIHYAHETNYHEYELILKYTKVAHVYYFCTIALRVYPIKSPSTFSRISLAQDLLIC